MAAKGTMGQRLRAPWQHLMPANAIIKRELLSTLRNPRYFRLLALTLAGLVGALLLFFYNYPRIELQNPNYMSEVSTDLLMAYGFILYGIAALLVPTVASNTICSEKQQEQLALVRMTYISPTVFLLGKATNVLGLFLLFLIATLPVVSILFYFTGVDWLQFAQMLLIVLMAAGSNAMAGLLCSAWFYRTLPAAMCTFLLVFLFQFAISFLGFFAIVLVIHWELMTESIRLFDWFLFTAPFRAIITTASAGASVAAVLVTLGYHGVIMGACGFLARRALDRPMTPMKVNQEKTIEDPRELETRRKQFPYYLIDPRRRRPLLGDMQDPILAKERYTSLANRGTTSIRILYSTAIIAVLCGAFSAAVVGTERDAEDAILGFVLIETLLLLCIAPTLIATSFSKEHEWGNWDMLRMTLLSPQQVVWGKFLGALHAIAPPALALLLGALPFLEPAIRFSGAGSALIFSLTMMGVNVVYLTALGTFAAVRSERSLPALVATYVLGVVALVGLPAIATVFLAIYRRQNFEAEDMAWLSPLSAQVLAMYEGGANFPNALFFAVVFFTLSLLLLHAACRRYSRDWQRDGAQIARTVDWDRVALERNP